MIFHATRLGNIYFFKTQFLFLPDKFVSVMFVVIKFHVGV